MSQGNRSCFCKLTKVQMKHFHLIQTKRMNPEIRELQLKKRAVKCIPMTSELPYGVLQKVIQKEIGIEEKDKLLETSKKTQPAKVNNQKRN